MVDGSDGLVASLRRQAAEHGVLALVSLALGLSSAKYFAKCALARVETADAMDQYGWVQWSSGETGKVL